MSALLDKVRLDASQLPQEEKRLLAVELIDSAWGEFEPPEVVEAAWNTEVSRRVAEIQSGAVEPISWERVKTNFAKEFGWDK